MRKRQPRQKDGSHLDFIRDLPCIVCGAESTIDAAHIRAGDPRAAKRHTGMGERPDDIWTLPLCRKHHDMQHRGGELSFWKTWRIDPIATAAFLALRSGDREAALMIIENARH